MSVYAKLQQAKIRLQSMQLKKSGHNKFAGYQYFELGDFLPQVNQIFHDLGLCSVTAFTHSEAILQIVDIEDGKVIAYTSPMVESQMKGALPIQNLGAVQTYQRRYLYMMALDIVEHDAIDASKQEMKITPNAGAGDDLPDDRKNFLTDVQIAIQDAMEVDDVPYAFQLYSEVTDNAEKLYLWSLLASKIRTAIKKHGELLKGEK